MTLNKADLFNAAFEATGALLVWRSAARLRAGNGVVTGIDPLQLAWGAVWAAECLVYYAELNQRLSFVAASARLVGTVVWCLSVRRPLTVVATRDRENTAK
jgi:hypothetical protein